MTQAAAIPKDKGLLIVGKDKATLEKLYQYSSRELARQAMVISRHTGLSLGFCSDIVLHRFKKRMERKDQ